MLAHSPPLPLAINYVDEYHDITAEDEEGAIHALKQRDRIRRVRLFMPVASLQKAIVAIDEECPILEYLIIMHPSEDSNLILVFPETLQAPHLRHLALFGFALPTGSRLLTTAVGLVKLCLYMDHPSTYFHPDTLLRWLSFMPQLQELVIVFFSSVPNHDVDRQLMHTPIMTPVTLPNLHFLWFNGDSTYLEAFVPWIITPLLGKLQIIFFNELIFSVPRLLQFINTTENLKFESAKFEFFNEKVIVEFYPREEAETYALIILVFCWHLDWQVSSVVQIFNPLSQVFPAVEHLTLEHEVHRYSSEEHNEVDRTEWRSLLRPFSNVRTLRIAEGLVKDLSRSLQSEGGELASELLPELQELTYSGSGNAGDGFTSFVDARKSTGRPITLVCRGPSPDPTSSVLPSETSSITPASIEIGNNFIT
jgi:hypothetical protein